MRKKKNEFHEYLDNPLEIYARINQLRFNRNLNPLQSVTLAEIADMRQSGILNRYYLDRYSDSYLYNILNNYAQNNTQSESASVNVARNGGQLKYYRKK